MIAGMAQQPFSQPGEYTEALTGWLLQLDKQLAESAQRVAMVLSGEDIECRASARHCIDSLPERRALILSDVMEDALAIKKARTQLGREYDVLVFDALDNFDPDAFGAVSGTLCASGLMIILLPDSKHWPALAGSRFLQRAVSIMQHHPGIYFLRLQQALPQIHMPAPAASASVAAPEPFRSLEQQQVVIAIVHSALHRQGLPVVLVSDRGRGKTSALGLAAARLLQQGMKTVLVTAPRLHSTDPLFEQAQRLLPEASLDHGTLLHGQGCLRFMAPDALLIEKPAADLLLVDEAAAMPLSLLQQMLQLYPATVFATTVHGYEGTGRGFALKFHKVLDARAAGWQQFVMHTPIRWTDDDLLEHGVDRLLCMDAELDAVPAIDAIDTGHCVIQLVNRDALLKDESKLSSLFALLVFAHYRTQPSDLKHLLDDSDVRLYTLEYQQHILGAVLVNEEGGFDAELCAAIYRGERRPSGHLLPQTLCFHAGNQRAAEYRYARIMRIAIHPALQGHGLGSHLLQGVMEQEQQQSVDAIGTSFGASAELLRFWTHAGFSLVRMGFSRDHASGTHSAVMLRAVSARGEQVFDDVRVRFRRYLSSWLNGPLRELPDDLRDLLRLEQLEDSDRLSADDRQELQSFAHTHRGVDACMWPLIKLLTQYEDKLDMLDETERKLLVGRLRQYLDWPELVENAGVTGRAQANSLMKRAVARLLELQA